MKNFCVIFSLFISIASYCQVTSTGVVPLSNTSTAPSQAVAAPGPCETCPPNVIAFDYDAAGNQWKRRFIYISTGVYRTAYQPATQPKKENLIESDISPGIVYYPNPVQSELFVKWTAKEDNTVESMELITMTGQLVRRFENLKNETTATIYFDDFPAGYYILNLSYTDGTVKDLRIIKK